MIDPIRDFFLYKYMEKYKTIIRLRLLFLSLQTSISNVSGGRLQIPSGEGVWTVLAPDKTKKKLQAVCMQPWTIHQQTPNAGNSNILRGRRV